MRLCVWLFAQNHLHLNYVDFCYFFALWAIQRKVDQYSILTDFGMRPASANRTGNPPGIFFPVPHWNSSFDDYGSASMRPALRQSSKPDFVDTQAIEWSQKFSAPDPGSFSTHHLSDFCCTTWSYTPNIRQEHLVGTLSFSPV